MQDIETVSPVKIRVVGVILLIIVIGMAASHAFTASISTGYFNTQANSLVGACLMMTGIFVVLGFGLTFAFYGENVLTSFLTVLYIVSASLLIDPLILKFWLNLFNNGFSNNFTLT